jgi:hypothetical protein
MIRNHLVLMAAACTLAAPCLAQNSLQAFVDRYPAIQSIALSANVSYFVSPLADVCEEGGGITGLPITGRYSYSASGGMWRSRSYMDHESLNYLRTEVAYDGAAHHYHMLDPDILSITLGDDDRSMGLVLPNPLLNATQFLIPVSDDNAHHDPTLSEIKAVANAVDYSSVTWTLDPASQGALEYADLPGDTHEGHAYIHRVYAPVGERDRPVRIDRIATNGAVLTRTLLSEYVDFGDDLILPTRFDFTLYDSASRAPAAQIVFDIDECSINSAATGALTATDFQIPWTEAERVWLNDLEVYAVGN